MSSLPDSSDSPDAPDAPVVEMPMFPLGSVLLPGGILPLHIFEIRYQQLLNAALESDRRFGVVLISRGSEVGGGEIRSDVGTVAQIDDYQRFDDGRAAVICSGTTRFQVIEWLDDDPFPRALVRELPTETEGRNDRDLLRSARASFDALIELGLRLGRLDSNPKPDWSPDLEEATWQVIGRAPCSALDQYAILAAPTRADRLARVGSILKDVYTDLERIGDLDGSGE